MTVLHAGGKFGGGGYKVSGGLHGVGVSVVNALSEWMRVESAATGKVCGQEYERGKPRRPVKPIGTSRRPARHDDHASSPTREIFENDRLQLRHLAQRFRELAYLTKGVHIRLVDERETATAR